MEKIIVPIKGMHCRSCELLVEENLKEIPGVANTNVSYKKKRAEIYCTGKPSEERIKNAIESAGYEIGEEEKKKWFTNNLDAYENTVIGLVVFAVLFFIVKYFGLFNFSGPAEGNFESPAVVLLIGLTAGFSTCMALVGGLVLSISARHAEKHPEATAMQKFRPHLFFNLGRIISYVVFGGLIGLLGSVFQLSGGTLGALTIIVGIVMLIMGIQLTELSPKIAAWSFTIPSSIGKFFGIRKHHEKEYSHTNSMMAGAVTFFLPCGFTQAMQLFAMSTGSFVSGSIIMGVFALGTLPGLLGIGGLTSLVKGAFAKKFFAFAGVLVIFFSIFNISNGYNLTGWRIPFFNNTVSSEDLKNTNVTIENGVQIARMSQNSSGYSPNQFIISKNMPVKWIIDGTDPYSCASSLILPKMSIRKNLAPGENVIEFTPTETGELKFSCSMGMYSGKFIVVDSGGTSNATSDATSNAATKTPLVPEEKPQEETPAPEDNTVMTPEISGGTQVLKTTYLSSNQDIFPNQFSVLNEKPVQFIIDVKEDGFGCMSTMTIPGLVDDVVLLEKDKQIVFNFTPKEKGAYYITCAMGVPRGIITVN